MVGLEYRKTQIFSRPGAGFLYEMRNQLPNSVNANVDTLWNNRKKGSINCEQDIVYKLSKSGPGSLGYGRLYGSKGSLERMEKECRGVLCKEFYHDIDVVNCHPVLLYQFAKNKFQIDLPEVEKLCDNRDAYLAAISDNRDDAKTSIIKILYGGKNTFPFLEPLAQEIKQFTKTLMGRPEYKDLYECCKTYKEQKNWEKSVVTGIYGVFLSFILQSEERKCMISMSDEFERKGWKVDVFCYDGVMIRKREGVDLLKDIQDAEKRIIVDTGYQVSLISKPFMTFTDFQNEQSSKEMYGGVELTKYLEMKREFEQNNFYYAPSSDYYEYRDGFSPLQMGLQHATEYYKRKWNFKVSDKIGDYIPFFPLWRDDAKAKTIQMISLRPSEHEDVFQIPMKLKYQKTSETSNSALEHFLGLVNLICNHKPELYEFILDWLAHCLQKPYENPRVGIVVVGAKGVGKDTLFDFFMTHVIGPVFSHNFLSTAAYFEKHNCDRMHKLMVKLEEADSKICWENANLLKGRISSDFDSFNPKGQKTTSTDNIARNAMTANGKCPVDLSDKERRFVVMNASSEKKSDTIYWNLIRRELFNDAAGRSIANYLLERDISSFDTNVLPVNEYQEAIIETRMTTEQIFIRDWDGMESKCLDLHNLYLDYCKTNALSYEVSSQKFGSNLMNMVKNNEIKVRRLASGVCYRK